MDRYVVQLIEDLRKAARNCPTPEDFEPVGETEEAESFYRWEFTEEKPMNEWFGISTDIFPDENRLADNHVEQLVKELIRLWDAFNFRPELPDGLPARLVYRLMVGYLTEPVQWIHDGITHIEFCHYDPEHCPFPEDFCYCKSLDDETDSDFDEKTGPPPGNDRLIRWLTMKLNCYPEKDYQKMPRYASMKRYCEQLLDDFLVSAKRAATNYTNFIDPQKNELRIGYELLSSKLLTLEELTGIKKEELPETFDMHCIHTYTLLTGIIRMLDAYDIIVNYQNGVPPEIFYDELRACWDVITVQHIPNAGDEIDLCTGETETCPFSRYCNCEEEFRMQMIIDAKGNKKNKDFHSPEEKDDLPF